MEDVHVYENHVPSHEWLRDHEGGDTLIVHVPGFKKDHLKILIGGDGKLIATGERPLSTDQKRSRRFREEFRLPENCKVEQIKSKLEGGILRVVLPKLQQPDAANKNMGEKSTDWKMKLKTVVGMAIGLHEPVGKAFMVVLVMAVTAAAWCLCRKLDCSETGHHGVFPAT